MEDDSAIKKAGIAKLNGSNYWTWAAIAKAVIEAKDAWKAIEELPAPEAKTPVEDTDNGTARFSNVIKPKVQFTDRMKNAKARTIIIGYCGQEALLRILYL